MNRLITVLAAAALLALVCGCSNEPNNQAETRTGPSQTYTMEQFVKTLSIGGRSFNHDETRLLVNSNESGIFQVYELDLATGKRTPVTEGEETTFAVAYMPHDERHPLHPRQGRQRKQPSVPARY